jgi:hypothetical protein
MDEVAVSGKSRGLAVVRRLFSVLLLAFAFAFLSLQSLVSNRASYRDHAIAANWHLYCS